MKDTGLRTENIFAGYGDKNVLEDISLQIPAGEITAILGANASGKSTLLRTMARLLKPSGGQVVLNEKSVHSMHPKELSRAMALLPQSPIAPEGITVTDLVSRGRNPHHNFFSRWTARDDEAVAAAMLATATQDLAERMLDELSGGQRQRVWLAMALAQDTEILLLDEPTTFLDINHQIEMLDLLAQQRQSRGSTIVMVLHDLNLAARYADNLVLILQGRVHSFGEPAFVLTKDAVREVFGLEAQILVDPVSGKPYILPLGKAVTYPAQEALSH